MYIFQALVDDVKGQHDKGHSKSQNRATLWNSWWNDTNPEVLEAV